ncbi:MAG: hypothetical protein QXD66_01325 [Candidatus Nezhaarchaeales archaeon]|nr:MAG: hypothetical protein DSO06_01035 [Candidatus Nezhaarchaeota archaeon WYZ-LMO8]TDA37359.1 MAG: hypothetical protein DSO05_00140 [Candidatus Nezhaarchaeota archaeon WYZ-LMO7]
MSRAVSVRSLRFFSQVAGLVALAVVLKFFEIPYPPAPFLKYDVSGIPLVLISFISLKYALGILPIYYVIPVTVGFDPIGMAMKCLAEASTFAPLTLIYRVASKISSDGRASLSAVITASLGRVAIMSLANYIVTPYWLLWAGWLKDLETARAIVVIYLPHIAVFNLTLALIVASISITAYIILRRSGYLK